MPVVKPIEQTLEQIYLPSTKDLPNEEDRVWVVLDISPLTGRDLMTVERRDSTGMTILKGLVDRLKEWNLYLEVGKQLPINLQTIQDYLSLDDITFLNEKIGESVQPANLAADEKKV